MPKLTAQSDEFIRALVTELEVPEERYAQAERSYKSFGEWTQRDDSTVRKFGPDVYVQGSFRLGTAIKPSSDQGEYDIDMVCVLSKLDKSGITQKQLKTLLETEVRDYRESKGIKKPVKEGQRCWTLEYADGAQFHMDILPALPNAERQRVILEKRGLDTAYASSAIAITDRDHEDFHHISDDWPRSNPKGYAEWFKSRMAESFERIRKQILDEQIRKGAQAKVEDIPEYRVRTPLQQAIMVLKRHRDDMFDDNPDDKPASIIITTLAAHAYGGEVVVGDALLSIVDGIEGFIRHDGQSYVIPNPTDGTENFADRWIKYPERQVAFFKWLAQVQADFLGLSRLTDYQAMAESHTTRISTDLRKRALARLGQASGASLLGSATPAPAASGNEYSFSDEPRKPQAPRDFA